MARKNKGMLNSHTHKHFKELQLQLSMNTSGVRHEMKRQSKEIPANINSYTQASNQDKYNYKE
jgi:hypothetical protein